MALDPSIFMNYAALINDQNKQLLQSVDSGIDSAYKQKALQVEAEKAKLAGLDLDKLATPALIKMQSGQPLDAQETAILKAWDATETRKLAPDAQGNYRRVNASIFTAPQQGFDLNRVMSGQSDITGGFTGGLYEVPKSPNPDTFIGGTNEIGNMGAPANAPAPNDKPLTTADIQKLFPAIDSSQVADALPRVPAVSDAGFDAVEAQPLPGFNLEAVQPKPQARVQAEVIPGNPNATQKSMEAAATARVDLQKQAAASQIDAAKEIAVDRAKADREKSGNKNKAEAALRTLFENSRNSIEIADDASRLVNEQTAGLGSNIKDMKVPFTNINIGAGSKSADLAAMLESLKGDSFVANLQEMRNNSPTGGAVGNATEKEGDRLASLQASLMQEQSPAQLKKMIANYQKEKENAIRRVADAFEKDYGYRPDFLTNTATPKGPISYKEYFK